MMKYFSVFRALLNKRQAAGRPGSMGIKGWFLLSIIVLFFSLAFSVPALHAGWDDIQNVKYIRAAIDHTKTDEALSDFPVLLYLSNICGADGSDVSELFEELSSYDDRKKMAVYTSGTQCHAEIEQWDSSAGEAWLWVMVPEIMDDGDTELRIYYDKTKEPNSVYIGDTGEPAARSVWDSSFVGVWHLGQDTGEIACIPDSSGNGLYGIPGGTSACGDLADGITGKAAEFPGSGNSRIDIDLPADYNMSVHTLEAFVYRYPGNADESGIIASSDSDDSARIGMADNISGSPGWGAYTTFGDVLDTDDYIGGNALVPDTWTYLAYKFDGVSQKIYENGAPVNTKDQTGRIPSRLSSLMIGNQYNTTYEFSGIIEEVRISAASRSDAWIKATWHTVSDDLIRYVCPVPSPGVNTLTVNPKGDGVSVILDWTGYDELTNGPAYYRIYAETSVFTDVSGLTPVSTVPAGQFTYTAENLARGIRYYFAVVPVGSDDNALITAVATVSAVPADITAPADVSDLRVGESSDTRLIFTWNHSADTHGDLAGYRVYFNGAAEGVIVNPGLNIFEADGLDPAAAYEIRVAAYDNDGNESSGITGTGITLLENPANLEVTPENGRTDLAWDAATPVEYVRQYNIYFSETDFSDVGGMTPNASMTLTSGSLEYTGTSTPVAGLKTGTTYYFAVTAVNISGGEQKSVSTVSVTTLPETTVSGHITKDTIWTLAGSPYIVTGDVTVRHTSPWGSVATLTIEPGTEVRFRQETGLYIGYLYVKWDRLHYYGALSARGTEASPIIFTSDEASPAPGDWKGIVFKDETADDLSFVEHSVVEYAGHTDNGNIYCASSSPRITHSVIRHSSGHGIRLHSSSSRIGSSVISNNGKAGIYISGTSEPVIGGEEGSGNTIAFSGTCAVYCEDKKSHPVITHNAISDYGSFAVRTGAKMILHDNTYSGGGIRAVEVLGDNVTADTTWNSEIPVYVVDGNITVRHAAYGGAVATLTIEPGTEVRFRQETGLYIGYLYVKWNRFHYYGALSARGTEASPIIFTSDEASPAPGDWKGIVFKDETADDLSFVEHSVVEYAGRADDDDNIYDDANIYLANAKPTIQYNTIRNSRSSGIYATGTGCNGATLNCNNLKDNVYGIYTAGNASPLIQNNNFLRNQTSGLYNESSISLNAENNWWGDAAGPNNSGDHISGNADHDPWLTEESGCISTPPTNSPPFAPTDPAPADSAIRVPVTDGGQPADVALTWTGRDPNPWDTLVFDVFFGDAEDNLQKAAESIPDAVHVMSGLAEGATYYWQIMIRDDSGEETAGPVWHFTTLGNPPDLLAEAVTWSPESGIIPGQEVTFTAVIRNIGTGPVVDSFQADFKIDGSVIKTVPVSTVIHVGESVQVSSAWSARAGIHTVGVVADSASEVVETSEDNNSLTVSLPDIIDDKPPALVSTAPADGASVQEVRQIVITLSDGYGTVDDTAVTGSIIVLDSSNQPVAGTISEAGDVFTFVPAASPLENGTYTVSLTGADTAGNTQDFSFSFTTDSLAPAGLSITGGSVTSGVIRVLPFQNLSDNPAITLTGTREDNTSVWINNVRKADSGTGDWSVSLSLPQGEISLEIWLEDIAGNRSPSELVDILTDSVAPSVISVTPSDGSFLNTVPAAVTAEILEDGTGLNTGSTSLSVKDSSQAEIPGDWTFSGTGLIFTPAGAFSDSVYTVDIQLEDNFGNRGALLQNSFTVDTVRPPDPGYDPVVSPTYNPTQIITGTKEAFAAILLDSEVIAGHTSGTTWEYTAALNEGENLFVLTAQDRAGNLSETVTFSIVYDDSPPPPVNTLTADGQGDGTVVVLNWGGYDESVRRPVASYRIYAETSDFTDVSALTEHGTADAGTFSFAAENLDRNTTYWFAVTAADSTGRADTSVTTVSAAAEDTVGPEDITGLLARCFADRLEFSWNHSADTHGDLAGYRVWFGNETEGTELLPEQNTFEKTGLDSAAGYLFRIAAFDNDENESNEVFVTGITLLPDPENLSAAAYNGYAELVWDYAGPPEYLRHFAVYVSETEFSDVSDMTPLLTASENSAKIENLANGVTYWFAVTAVNESGCEQKQVTPVSATLQSDTDGPEITDVMAGDSELENGHILFKTKTITLNTADISGTDRVEFYLNDTLICTDSTGTPGYSCEADITGFEYGDYTFEIRAYDSPGNMSSVEYTVSVIPLPPYECFQSCIEEDSQLLAPKLRFGNALTGKAPGLPVQEAGTN